MLQKIMSPTGFRAGIVILTGCLDFFGGGFGASASSAGLGFTSSSNSSVSGIPFTAGLYLGSGKAKTHIQQISNLHHDEIKNL